MIAGRKALEDEVIPEYLGMWWIHVSALFLALLLLGKERPAMIKIKGLLKRNKVAA